MSTTNNFEKGDLLIAEPFMKDSNFKRTVTLICEHDAEGTIGLVLNRPSIFKINEMIPNFPAFQGEVYYGGPIGMDRLNYIHSYGDMLPNSFHIKDNLYWNGVKHIFSPKIISKYELIELINNIYNLNIKLMIVPKTGFHLTNQQIQSWFKIMQAVNINFSSSVEK